MCKADMRLYETLWEYEILAQATEPQRNGLPMFAQFLKASVEKRVGPVRVTPWPVEQKETGFGTGLHSIKVGVFPKLNMDFSDVSSVTTKDLFGCWFSGNPSWLARSCSTGFACSRRCMRTRLPVGGAKPCGVAEQMGHLTSSSASNSSPHTSKT